MAYFKVKGGLYRWQKWNAKPAYAQASETISDNVVWSGDFTGKTVYGYATAYAFNVQTGRFQLSGGQEIALGGSPRLITARGERCICGYPGEGDNPSRIAHSNSPANGYLNGSNSAVTGANPYRAVRYWAIQSGWQKGDNMQGYELSKDANAYPINGRHSDGYWYIKMPIVEQVTTAGIISGSDLVPGFGDETPREV